MKIFISWSGERSRAVADLVSDWIKCVLQASRPWISTRDIDRGAIWFSEISDQLKDTSVGIVCLTHENKDRPWILFESGALAKGLSSNRVCTFLVDLQPADLHDPLAQFNHTLPNRTSMWALVRSLNNWLELNALDERILDQVFETYWPQFEKSFSDALNENLPATPSEPRSETDLLTEILNSTRGLNVKIRDIEARMDAEKRSTSLRHPEWGQSNYDRKAIQTIRKMLDLGKSDAEIVSNLVDYDMPESYASALVAKTRSES